MLENNDSINLFKRVECMFIVDLKIQNDPYRSFFDLIINLDLKYVNFLCLIF